MDRRTVLERTDTARAELLKTITGLDEVTVTTLPVVGNWTIREVLAHLAGWATWHLGAMRQTLAGEPVDLAPLADREGFNVRWLDERGSRTMTEVLDELEETRVVLEELLRQLPEAEIFRGGHLAGPQWDNLAGWLRVIREHEEEHTAQLRAWRAAIAVI